MLNVVRRITAHSRRSVYTSFNNVRLLPHSSLSRYLSSAASDYSYDDKNEESEEERKHRLKEERREELKNKTGRLWSDPWDVEDVLESKVDFDSLPEFSAQLVSRISQERVKIYEKKIEGEDDSDATASSVRKIPTLDELAALSLPPPPPPNPASHTKMYALQRKRMLYKNIQSKVIELAEPKIEAIQKLTNWQDKQDAVDVLFEDIEFTLKEREVILGKQPKFGEWVERALEDYLRTIQQKNKSNEDHDNRTNKDEDAVPIFMDLYRNDIDSPEEVIPSILRPLRLNPTNTTNTIEAQGRMVEEWELSAHKTTKRIMLRQCTRTIAQLLALSETDVIPRILIHGKHGVGKTAAMAAIVASARSDNNNIVLYLPEGDQMHQNGYYIEPNAKRNDIFDLPILSQHVCQNMLDVHENELSGIQVPLSVVDEFFTDGQKKKLHGYETAENDNDSSISLIDLLKSGINHVEVAGSCYSIMVDVLMKQDEKAFIMVMDEINCLYTPGKYFHSEYDNDFKHPKSIPYKQINLFKPILDIMNLSAANEEDYEPSNNNENSLLMKRGGVIVGTTESHAVARNVTDNIVRNAKLLSSQDTSVHVIEIPRLSNIEVDNILANYECIGIGKLRLDRGETVMNEQEVAYLRVVSGSIPQRLMNASMME